MTCRTCSRPIPGGLLACAICTRSGSDRAIRECQYAPLRKVMARLGKLTVRAVEGRRHLQMFGAEETYCGVDLWPGHRTSRIEYDPVELRGICAKCRARLDELAGEARRAT